MKYLGVIFENLFLCIIYKKVYVNNLIFDDKVWISLLEDRNLILYIYNENLVNEIVNRIVKEYVKVIGELVKNLENLI